MGTVITTPTSLPRVSVCLLTYKRAQLLPRTLDLLLGQSHTDFELIIHDDCSPDHTEDVCRDYARRDARVRYVRNPQNLGYANNQNAAILRASCEHVAIVHDGDIYHPQLLAAWTEALLAHPSAALVFNAAEQLDAGGQVTGTHTHPYGSLTHGVELFDQMLTSPYSPIFGIVMLRRSRVLAAGPFDPRLPTLADVDMWLRLMLAHDVAYVAKPLYAIATREADHHNNYTNWRVRHEAELIYELNWRRRYRTDEAAGGEQARRAVARMLMKQRARQLASCARHRQWAAVREGLAYTVEQPPFGARLLRDSVTTWAELEGLVAPTPSTEVQVSA